MKNQIFVAFGLSMSLMIPNAIVANAETTEAPSTTVDMQGDYVSFDDIVTALEGKMEESETGRTYLVQEKSFLLNYGKGYSFVDESPEPFLLEPSAADSSVLTVTYTTPVLFNEELFVPIPYVERLLELDYKDGVFEQNGEPLFKGEDFVVVTPPTDSETDSDSSEEGSSTETGKGDNSSTDSTDSPVQTPGNDHSNSNSGNSSTEEVLTVKNIYVNQSSVKLEAGQSTKVNAVVDPFNVADASITWKSGNTNVATVDNKGNIYAVAEGTTTLTVTSNMNPSVKANVSVTVTAPPVIVATSVSVNKTWIDLEVGGSTKVSAWVSPENTTNKGIQWSSENSSVATVDGNGNIVAKGEGYTRIIATATSNSSAKAYVEVNVKAKPSTDNGNNNNSGNSGNNNGNTGGNTEPTPPSAPTYTGSTVVNQLLGEGFWKGMAGTSAFHGP